MRVHGPLREPGSWRVVYADGHGGRGGGVAREARAVSVLFMTMSSLSLAVDLQLISDEQSIFLVLILSSSHF